MRPGSARRTALFASGPGAERGPYSLLTSDTTTLICSAQFVLLALALPYADTDMMQLHLNEISRNVAEGAHAVLLLDRAGWHTTGKLVVPENITPIFLPSRAPELNPVENICQYLRQTWLSNTVFENYDAILDAACDARESSSHNPNRSHQSECETGPTSVRPHDRGYQSLRAVSSTPAFSQLELREIR
jgi:hypothetical protein